MDFSTLLAELSTVFSAVFRLAEFPEQNFGGGHAASQAKANQENRDESVNDLTDFHQKFSILSKS